MEKQSKVRAAMAKAGAVVTAKRAAFGGALLMAASSANAALPEVATQAFSTLASYVTEMLTSTWGNAHLDMGHRRANDGWLHRHQAIQERCKQSNVILTTALYTHWSTPPNGGVIFVRIINEY